MAGELEIIISKIREEGKDYSDFRVLLVEIEKSGISIPKDELSEFLNNDFRIQLHTTPSNIANQTTILAQPLNPKDPLESYINL